VTGVIFVESIGFELISSNAGTVLAPARVPIASAVPTRPGPT
jgi:hypothetical protein